MMPLQDGLFSLAVWAMIAWVIWRQWQRQTQHPHPKRRSIMLLLVAAGLVFSLRTWAVQVQLDQVWRHPIPLGGTLRMTAIMIAGASYWQFLQALPTPHLLPHSLQTRRLLTRLPWLALASFGVQLGLAHYGYLSYHQAYFLNLLVGDLAATGLIVGAFAPINLRLLKVERMAKLRVKYFATLGLCSLYLLAFVLSLPSTLQHIFANQAGPPQQYPFLAGLGAVCVILQIAPFKVLTPVCWLCRYEEYWELCRLEQQAARGSQGEARAKWWVKPTQLGVARQYVLILLLDHQAYLPHTPEYAPLHQDLRRLLQNDHFLAQPVPPYD